MCCTAEEREKESERERLVPRSFGNRMGFVRRRESEAAEGDKLQMRARDWRLNKWRDDCGERREEAAGRSAIHESKRKDAYIYRGAHELQN